MVATSGFVNLVAQLTHRTDVSRETFLPIAEEVVRRRTGASDAATAQLTSTPRRYIVAPPTAQKSAGPSVRENLRAIQNSFPEAILRSQHEDASKVMRMTPLEAALLKERYGALVVEEDVQYRMARSPLLPVPNSPVVPAAAKTVRIVVESGGVPVPLASVVLLTSVANSVGYEARTDANGRATVSVRDGDVVFERVIIDPRAGYWSKVLSNVPVTAQVTFQVDRLPIDGFGWGQLATEAATRGVNLGAGVRIAVIDSGIGRHSSLAVRGGRNFILNEPEGAWDNDVDGHGTHCAGVISALQNQASTWGYAPQAELFALRVFGGADGGGFASDIGDAIKWAVENGCDIISMSLGSAQPSSYIRRQIELANDAGVLCVAATGNDAGPVSYPAKFRDVVGVGAIGRFDAYPADSLHATAQSARVSANGLYYLASFSNHGDVAGDDVDFCAPGVAVASTLPASEYGAWDGTSMACPHVSGIAALALGAPSLAGKPRDPSRRDLLHDRLIAAAIDLGIGRTYTGAGLPTLSRVLQLP
jgi:subtilisin family serine protease